MSMMMIYFIHFTVKKKINSLKDLKIFSSIKELEKNITIFHAKVIKRYKRWL